MVPRSITGWAYCFGSVARQHIVVETHLKEESRMSKENRKGDQEPTFLFTGMLLIALPPLTWLHLLKVLSPHSSVLGWRVWVTLQIQYQQVFEVVFLTLTSYGLGQVT